ncbi:MAG TPA: hypothetical protein VN682_10505 [Terriglobales bacterium]|nr:hypothetical protein [Terriglobales bacterium]
MRNVIRSHACALLRRSGEAGSNFFLFFSSELNSHEMYYDRGKEMGSALPALPVSKF